jgi:hypothetical protein
MAWLLTLYGFFSFPTEVESARGIGLTACEGAAAHAGAEVVAGA